ncbi:MAG: cbb3-type cytochrome c oxidase N-terminal domain-containing protein [Candidatus Marinimicrobia bacterium]|nr:cbb3-type cytochrome c oxidase N-terminal domain-containing protein [Candidatus Neomarinimicrobiota bacterium]
MGKITNQLIEHDFDGIQEYDNDLPGWWKSLFWLTIIIAVIYVPYYHLVGDLQEVEYQKEMGTYSEVGMGRGAMTGYSSPFASDGEMTPAMRAEMDKVLDAPFDEQLMRAMSKADSDQLAALEAAFPEVYASYASGGVSAPAAPAASVGSSNETPPEALAILTDDASLEAGKKVWDTQCFSCHLNDGGGMIGPNMTDDYWIHGGDMASIVHLINVGVPAKGMVPWETILTPDQISQVASFIKVKLVGTTPAVAKAPQGDLFEE